MTETTPLSFSHINAQTKVVQAFAEVAAAKKDFYGLRKASVVTTAFKDYIAELATHSHEDQHEAVAGLAAAWKGKIAANVQTISGVASQISHVAQQNWFTPHRDVLVPLARYLGEKTGATGNQDTFRMVDTAFSCIWDSGLYRHILMTAFQSAPKAVKSKATRVLRA